MKTFLKVKIISLGDEARTIRRLEKQNRDAVRSSKLGYLIEQEENIRWEKKKYRAFKGKSPKPFDHTGPSILRQRLHEHRMQIRREVRAAHLAYGFLRGRSYRTIENKTKNAPNWHRVIKIILQFGREPDQVLRQRFAEWIDNSGLPENLRYINWDHSWSRRR